MPSVLVVEDYPDNMALIEEILEDEGYQVLLAEDAEKGLSILESNEVDLVLMDISLPRMTGLEATRIIKANSSLQHIPVIAITAHAMKKDEDEAMEAGCSAFLTKPVNEEEVLKTVKRIIKSHAETVREETL